MTQEDHYDVASYALGVLDDRDAARFEDHLIECPQCAFELESFVQVADVLADVDAEALLAAEKSEQEGVLLNKMFREVKVDRQRANSRRLYSLAAAVVVFAMLSIGALFVGGQIFGSSDTPAKPGSVAQRGSDQLDPLPDSDGLGFGGTKLPGVNYEHTDERTNVRAAVGLEKKDWGTQISFAVGNLTGPKTCALVLVHTDGTSEQVSTWKIGDKGWGTAANPAPLMLQTSTATPREDIAHVQVREVNANGAGETLVSAL
jgi:hypothetical protein